MTPKRPPNCDPAKFQLITQFRDSLAHWEEFTFLDRGERRKSGAPSQEYFITTTGETLNRVVRAQSLGELLQDYRVHAEAKSAGPDGEECTGATAGLLQRRPVRVRSIRHIGKESNELDDVAAGLVHDADEVIATYGEAALDYLSADQPSEIAKQMAAALDKRVLHDKILGAVGERTLRRLRSGRVSRRVERAIVHAGAQVAREALRANGRPVPNSDERACEEYLALSPIAVAPHALSGTRGQAACGVCGQPLVGRQRRYCSTAHKQLAFRRRTRASED